VLGLARALDEVGEQVVLIGPGLPEGATGVDLGRTVPVPANGSLVPVSIDPRVPSRIKDAVGGLDLLHIHEPFMPVVSLAALRAGTPAVATFHAAPGAFGTGLYTVFRSRLRRLLGPNVRRVTAVSRTAAAPLPDDLGVTIIPNGIDVASFQSDVERHPERISFLGRDEKRKGLDVLIDAWTRVHERVPKSELVVMGARRDRDDVTWMGRVEDGLKIEILNSSAILVAPNLGGESFGIVLVEAMASGAAVVASALGAFRDVAADAARYFETGNADALAGLLIDLLADEETRAGMAASGYDRANEFDWKMVGSRYLSVYCEAVS